MVVYLNTFNAVSESFEVDKMKMIYQRTTCFDYNYYYNHIEDLRVSGEEVDRSTTIRLMILLSLI